MANKANINVRVDKDLKKEAENILTKIGVSLTSATVMFLKQVVLHKGIPFAVKLPQEKPLVYDFFTKEQFDFELEKGMADIEIGKTYSMQNVEEEMKRDFGI